MKTKIEIRNLKKSFGSKIVLNDVNLDIEEKKSLVILGKSGTGKSVLIRIISTLLEPDDGSIIIDGRNILNLKEKDRFKLMDKFGFLFQNGALFDSLKIWENIAFKFINNYKMSKNEFVCKYKTVRDAEYILSTVGRDARRAVLAKKKAEAEAREEARRESNRKFMEERRAKEERAKEEAVKEQFAKPEKVKVPKETVKKREEGSKGAKNFMAALRELGYAK